MKQLILLLLILPNLLSALEIYKDSSNQEYLSLGSTENGKRNFLNLKNIDWISLSELQQMQQIDILSPHIFWDKVNQNSIGFHASGYEPFWNAKLTKNKLQFVLNKEENVTISIDIKSSALTNNFVTIFHSDNGIYGLIRSLSNGTFCEANLDELTSIYRL